MTEPNRLILTEYPHDALTYAADALGQALRNRPGCENVLGVILLDDGDDGCIHPVGYPQDTEGVATMLANVSEHFVNMGRAVGVDIEVYANGRKMPVRSAVPETEEE